MDIGSVRNMTNNYQRKIKTAEELKEIIGYFNSFKTPLRTQKVIMCHGTFDLVHPGHIRHLMYAKDKADILIVSLTGDAFVDKSDYRPFVPADLRAMNLAALEVVDYVITDNSPTPINNINILKPDYFAKGYDRICIIDSDIFVRVSAPSIFPELEDKPFGAVVEREMPITPEYEAKIRNYSIMQYHDIATKINFKPNNKLGYEWYLFEISF